MHAAAQRGPEARFECILEPWDTWMVWDRLSERPAMLGDDLLMSLEAEAAESACCALNGTDPAMTAARAGRRS